MPETRMVNGVPYVRQADGNWHKVRQGPPADPTFPLQAPRVQSQIANTQTSTARTQQQMRRDDALLPAEIKLKNAQADAAVASARKSSGLDPQKRANIDATQAQIDRLRRLYKAGPGRTKGFSSVLDYLPTDANAKLDTAGAGLGDVAFAAFRTPGAGSQSDAELRAFIDANRPSASDRDVMIEEKLNNLQNRLSKTYGAYGVKPPRKGGGGWKIEPID